MSTTAVMIRLPLALTSLAVSARSWESPSRRGRWKEWPGDIKRNDVGAFRTEAYRVRSPLSPRGAGDQCNPFRE
jgi:hypothetical protein